MASVQGKKGKLRFNGVAVVKVKNWSLSIERDILDDSELGAEWRDKLIGIGEWSGSFELNLDPGDTNGQLVIINALLAGTASTDIELITDDSGSVGAKKGFTGNIVLKSLGVDVDFESITGGSWEFEGNGAITYSAVI